MTKVDIVKTGASWRRMIATLLVVIMVAMVAAPMIKAEAAPVTPPAESSIPDAPAEAGAPVQAPSEAPLKPQTPEGTGESKPDSKNLPTTTPQQNETPPVNAMGALAPEDGGTTGPDPENPGIVPEHGGAPEPEQSVGFVPEDLSAELAFPPTDASVIPDPVIYSAPIYPTPLAVLWDNGPLVTGPGAGAGGADVSALQTALGMNTYGFGAQYTIPNRMADDFTVLSDWTVDSFTFFSYQTGSTTASTFTGVYVQIWDAAPNGGGAVIWGDMVTNRMSSTVWSNIYRVLDTNLLDVNRPVMEVVADTPGLVLPAGTYWVDFAFTGTLGSGPWMPPISILGTTTTGNALQWTQGSGMWNTALDTGTGTQQGAPFIIEGNQGIVELSPDYQSEYCSFNGEQVDYSLTLTNNLPTTEVFDLTAANNAWPTDLIYLGPSASQLVNPSFETGDFTGWITSDLAAPFSALQVSGAGNDPWGSFFDSAPTDGANSLQTGFDGDGPGHIMAGQDFTVPVTGETGIIFDYRAAWDLEMIPATIDRTFSVNIEPAGGGVPLQTNVILTATADTLISDTGILPGFVDLTPYAGTTIFINFDWWVPEDDSGPAFFELDNVRVMTSSSALLLSEGFEGAFPPTGWTHIQNNVAETWHQENLVAHTGTYSATCFYDPALNPQDEWLITPPLDLRASTNTQLSFWWLMSYFWGVNPNDNYDFNVYVSTDGWGTLTLLWNEDTMGAFANFVWYDTSMGTPLDLSAYDGMNNVQIGFQYAGTDGAQLSIDDITITATPSALGPVPPGGSMPFIARVTVPPGAVPGDFDIADITATTQAVAPPLPLEGFEGAFPPAGWTVVDYDGMGGVWLRNDGYGNANLAGGIGFCADADSDSWFGPGVNTGLRTHAIDLSAYTTASMDFDQSYNDITPGGGDYSEILVSTDGGGTWTQILFQDEDHSPWGPGEHVTLSLDAFAGAPNVIIEFHYDDSNWDWWWMIDNVIVYEPTVSSNTAQVETIWPNAFPWSDNMESGTALWDADGLWHLVDDLTSPYPNSYSPTHSWWYGQDATGDYSTGFRNWGRLETPPIDLTGETEAAFSFAEWFYTEGSNWDQRWIQYNAGSGWFDIQQLPDDPMNTWIHRTIDLSPYCGQIIRLGFWFDTLNEIANAYPGWYVDDFYVGPYAVDIWPDDQAASDYWTADVDYYITVDNLGSLPDEYDLSATGNTWPVTFWDATGTFPITSTGTVPAHGSRIIVARVTIPYGIADGTMDIAQVMATSQNNPGFTWDDAWVTTTALNPFGVDLTPDLQTGTGYVSTSYDYTMTVENTGVWNDRYDLSVAGNAWPTTLWNAAGTAQIFQTPIIAPGATYDFTVRVDIPALAPPGSWDMTTVFVTSQGDPVWTTDSAQVQTFSDNPYGVMLLPDYQEHTGSTGHYVDHVLTVYNTGVWPETYDLTATGNTWPVTFIGNAGGGGTMTLLGEDFEGGIMPPTGWSVIDGVSSTQHWRTLDAATYPMYVHSGAYGGWVNYQMADQDEWLISPNMAIPGSGASTTLEFWAQSDTNFPGATMILYAVEAGGAFTDTLWNLIADESWGTFDFHLITIDLTAYAGQNIHLVWQYVGNDGESFGLDDIEVTSTVPIVPTGPITSIGPIPPGSSMSFIARVDIPMGLPPGSFDIATIVATCHDYFYTWDDAIIRTNGEPEYWFDVGPPVQTNFGWYGDWVEHRVWITNLGTEPDIYLPMYTWNTGDPTVDADWWTKFFTVDLRPQGIYNGIDDGSETWWWGPVQPGETKEYAIKVLVPTDDIGAFDQARISITSFNDNSVVGGVEIWTRLSMPAPFYDDFELAGNQGEFGLYNDPLLGWIYSAWTRPNNDVDVNVATSYTGAYSMFTSGGAYSATTCKINMEMPYGIASCVIRRGDAGFSEDPDDGEDLIVEYSDGNLQWAEWHELATFPGGGTPGEILTPLWILPQDALNPRFQLRFRQADGSGTGYDFWHIDNVFIGAPESSFDLQYFNPPETVFFDGFEDGDFSDWTRVGASNDWEIGTPSGLGTPPDPVGAYAGTYSIGNDLTGLGGVLGEYENNVPANQNYIYSPAIDCSGHSAVTLEFYRWLGIESVAWDHAYIYVSNDAATWNEVWSHNTASFTDPAWTFMSYDISAWADNQATVYVRFDMGPTDGSVTYCGWNIDNFNIRGSPESIVYAGPGEIKTYDVSIENLARHCDQYTINVQGNTWPTEVLIPALEDDFSDLNLDGWNIVDEGTINAPSNWYVDGAGVLRQTGNIYAYPGQWLPGTYIWNGNQAWTDYTLSADMMSTDNDGIGLMARYTNSENYYRFHWSQQADTWDKDFTNPGFQRRVLDVCVDGAWQVLASDNVPYTTGQWYNVEMKLVGDSIQVYIDGNLIFDVTDDSHDQGAVGIYSWGNSAGYFDDVGVYTQTVGPLGPDGPLNIGSFLVYVDIPADAAGLSDTATITVTSILDPWVSETITLTTTAGRVHNLDQDIWYMDIQPAIDAANPGEHIYALEGVYNEKIFVNKQLTITGENADTTIIDGAESTGWQSNGIMSAAVPNILILHADDGNGEPLRTQLTTLGGLGVIDTFDARGATPSLAQLQAYDIVITWSNYVFGDPIAIGNVLADYVDSGGRVIDMEFAIDPSWGMQGRFRAEQYSAMSCGGCIYTTASLGTFNPTHPIMQGVTAASDLYRAGGTALTPGSTEVARWSDGNIFVAAKDDGTVVTINAYAGVYLQWTGQIDQVVHNSIFWLTSVDSIVKINADTVSFSGFTVQNGPVGILLNSVTSCDIGNNIIQDCGCGISLQDSGLNYIHDNEISNIDGETMPLSSSLETTFADNNAFAGNMFDVTLKTDLTITSIDVNVDTPGAAVTFEIYYRPGTYVGFDNSAVGWTLAATGTGTSQGQGNPTPIDFPDFALPAGDYGFFVYQSSYGVADTRYTDGNNVYDNEVMTITTGIGKGNPAFTGTTFTPRTWNGRILYTFEVNCPGIYVTGNSGTPFQDDFSVDTGAWTYSGNALRTGGYARLTQNGNGLVGQILYNQPIQTAFVAEFDYLAGQTGTDWVGYNDGYTETHIGLGGGGDITMAIELTDAELAAYRANDIGELYISVGSDADAFYVVNYDIWVETSLPAYGDVYTGGVNVVFSGTSSGTGWDTIDIPDYAIPDTGSVVIGINFMGTVAGDFPCGLDQTTTQPSPRGNYITYNGFGIWDNIENLGWPGMWGLDVGITTPYDLNGADGFAFNFFKEPYTPSAGGYLGCVDGDGTALGYSVEFDNYLNGGWDTSANHIGITRDNVWNHLASVYDLRSEDNAWHHAKVIVTSEGITVYVDDMYNPLLAWAGYVDMTYGGFSFSGGTGGLNNNHFVDNIHISFGNIIESNQVHNNGIGVLLWNTEGNQIFHNNFVNNGIHALDNGDMNMWDGGYPIGGNYWSGFSGPDTQNGPLQNLPGADGMIDNPYIIDPDSRDNYPLKAQYTTTGIVIEPITVVEEPVVEPVADPGDGTITAVPAAQPSPAVVEPEIPEAAEQAAEIQEPDTAITSEETVTPAPALDIQNEPVQENVAATPSGSGNIYLLALLAMSIVVMSAALFFRKRK